MTETPREHPPVLPPDEPTPPPIEEPPDRPPDEDPPLPEGDLPTEEPPRVGAEKGTRLALGGS